MAPKKCLPLSAKLRLLADQEKGFGPKALMKKYKIKKSSYYRIISEKHAIMNFALHAEPEHKLNTDDDVEAADPTENGENRDTVEESIPDENKEELHCDTSESIDGVNQAVLQWYNEQEADGVPVESADIDEAAERLAQKLGFTHFKLNSSGWPLRFRKPQDAVKTTATMNANDEENPEFKARKVLRIQDQITAFQRLQAGESAVRIGNDLGVSKTTILRIKKKLKDTLFTPSLDPNYQINIERLNTKKKSENSLKEKFSPSENVAEDIIPNTTNDSDDGKKSVWAAIERRKRLKLRKNGVSNKNRGLSYAEKVEAIAQYKSGITIKQIARNFACSTSTIQRAKREFSKSHKLAFKNYMRLEQKVSVVERLDEGETITEIADDLGVHETTIRSIRKNKLKIMNVYKASMKSIGMTSSPSTKSTVSEKIEKRLLAWINDLKRRKIPMSSAMIQKKALMIQLNISQEGGSSSSQIFTPSDDWLNSFKRRYNIQKMLHKEDVSESESDDQRIWKAGPKSKKKHIIGPRRHAGVPRASHYTSSSQIEGMTLSKFAEGLREMYLNSHLPADPYRCNAFTPRVILSRIQQKSIKKYTMPDPVKSEPLSDEETWLTAHTNVCSDSDWEEQNWDTNSFKAYKSNDSLRKKRKKTSSEHNRKRRRLSDGDNSDDGSVMDYNRSNFVNIPIKQEPQSSLDSVHSSVPMAVLPAGSTYVPPLPMFQMPTTGLTVFMPESQQMMVQHPVNYPHDNTSDLFLNQQQISGQTVANSRSHQFNDIHSEASIEPNIRQDNENMIVMPFGSDLCEQEKSRHLPSSHPDLIACDSLVEKTRKERAAAIAESMGITVEGSSHKKLRDLTFKLLELNNKNLICDERIDKAREEYERTVAHIEAEKKINDKEIDQVLAAIQEWKEAKSQSIT